MPMGSFCLLREAIKQELLFRETWSIKSFYYVCHNAPEFFFIFFFTFSICLFFALIHVWKWWKSRAEKTGFWKNYKRSIQFFMSRRFQQNKTTNNIVAYNDYAVYCLWATLLNKHIIVHISGLFASTIKRVKSLWDIKKMPRF